MQMEVRKSWIEANELIARRRDFEIKQELCGSGSYYKKLSDFIEKRDRAIAEREPALERRREKLKMAQIRKVEAAVERDM